MGSGTGKFRKLAPRQLLELKFDGSSELWADLSVVHSIQVTEVMTF